MTCKKYQRAVLEGKTPAGHLKTCTQCRDFYRHVQLLHQIKQPGVQLPDVLKKRTLSLCRDEIATPRLSTAQRLHAAVQSTEFICALGLGGLTAALLLSLFAVSSPASTPLHRLLNYLVVLILLQNIIMLLFGPLLLGRNKHIRA